MGKVHCENVFSANMEKSKSGSAGEKLKLWGEGIMMSSSVVNVNKKSVLNPHCLLSWDAIKGEKERTLNDLFLQD